VFVVSVVMVMGALLGMYLTDLTFIHDGNKDEIVHRGTFMFALRENPNSKELLSLSKVTRS
jgi:hypothetical protein